MKPLEKVNLSRLAQLESGLIETSRRKVEARMRGDDDEIIRLAMEEAILIRHIDKERGIIEEDVFPNLLWKLTGIIVGAVVIAFGAFALAVHVVGYLYGVYLQM